MSESVVAVSPKLRGRAAAVSVERLIREDAMAAVSQGGARGRSARRLFERLVEFGVVRELTGRSTFRLYGL